MKMKKYKGVQSDKVLKEDKEKEWDNCLAEGKIKRKTAATYSAWLRQMLMLLNEVTRRIKLTKMKLISWHWQSLVMGV